MTHTLIAITLAAVALTDVAVQRVNDRRSAGPFAHLELVVELPKFKDTEVDASRVVVAAATDETGADLVDREHQVELAPNFVTSRDATKPATVSLTLKNPARRATKLKEVRGEIELYMPGKDPNSVAEIAKFTSFSGKPLAHKALKANGVEISLISPAQLAAERKKAGDAKRKEYVADGYEGESLEQMVSSFVESFLSVDESDVVMRVKDPQKRIQEMAYVDGQGQLRRASVRDEEGYTLMSIWNEPPQPDWKLRVSMITPKNMVKHAFVLKDVPLP